MNSDETTISVDKVETEDYWLPFRVPAGLMPDSQFAGRSARLLVHRVRPVYANGNVPTKAVVLIHGRTVPGPVVFDLQEPTPPTGGPVLSVQKALALAGIDTFAPSLLGYGLSTRFYEGLDDAGNASLSLCPPTGTPPPEGCDRNLIPPIQPLNQQEQLLLGGHPLDAKRRHSSNFRFARTDVWVRDIDQVIDDAIKKNEQKYGGPNPDGGMVTLVGYSLGGRNVGRTLYADNHNEQLLYADDALDHKFNEKLHDRDEVIKKVKRVVFVNSFFGLRPGAQGELIGIEPTEEPANPFGPPTFPMTLDTRTASDALWNSRTGADCNGRIIAGTQQQVWDQTMENDTVGRAWGTTAWPGPDLNSNDGLNRSPTFSGYGWNREVARKLSLLPDGKTHPIPALVIQGLEDGALPTGPTGRVLYTHLFEDPKVTPKPKKVLVEVECGSHVLQWEGCDSTEAACTPHYKTFQNALIEWITKERFNNELEGVFNVNRRGDVTKVPSTA